MPHDPEEVIAFAKSLVDHVVHANQVEEIAQLRDENAQLRTMIATMLRALKQVEICLQMALDREKK